MTISKRCSMRPRRRRRSRASVPTSPGRPNLRLRGRHGATTFTEAATISEEDDIPGGEFGERARAALRQAVATIEEMESELGRLDAAAGDGDHGAGMVRGLRAAVEAIAGFEGTARQTFRRGGSAFQNAAGGASGALVGAWLIAIGTGSPTATRRSIPWPWPGRSTRRWPPCSDSVRPNRETRRWLTLSRRSLPRKPGGGRRNGAFPSLGHGSPRGSDRDALDDRYGQPPWPRLATGRALAGGAGCGGDVALPRPARLRHRIHRVARDEQSS